VREAWPSPATGTDVVEGELGPDESLRLVAETDGLVVFGDGIEADRLIVAWGQAIEVRLARRSLRLVRTPQPEASDLARRSASHAATRIPSQIGVSST
jgi:hypothetical protein